jgi:shikimate dehydrogenase
MKVNKDTKLYGSFSSNPGNNGCNFFNTIFEEININAIYRSFFSDDLAKSISAAKCLGFSGCAISMPFKKTAYSIVDELDESAIRASSVNTILFGEKLKGFNTDYLAVKKLLEKYGSEETHLTILGNGGLATAVKGAADALKLENIVITRDRWSIVETLQNKFIFNCTPLKLSLDSSNKYIDCHTGTITGDELFNHQAKEQLRLYGY